MTDETRKFLDELLSLYRFSNLIGQLCIDEHKALENPRVKQQIAVKECLDHKLANLERILERENRGEKA